LHHEGQRPVGIVEVPDGFVQGARISDGLEHWTESSAEGGVCQVSYCPS
jgi:hypothetical protein